MNQLGSNGPFIRKCLEAALGCLDSMLSGKSFEPNDLIAGALGLDQLTRLIPNAGQAAQVAHDLRVLARNCNAVRTDAGQQLAEYLERGLTVISRLIADDGEASLTLGTTLESGAIGGKNDP